GAIAGVMVADYWIVRRRQLDITDLYRVDGQYPRWNWAAFVAMAIAVVPVIPGFIAASTTPGGVVSNPGFVDSLYTYGWFFTFAVALVAYWAMQVTTGKARAART
ncbi:MAG: cytosine permease, partial [Proteobacteria bacterium]|nr:cytosine permease [Pseudomonadota bacterium]